MCVYLSLYPYCNVLSRIAGEVQEEVIFTEKEKQKLNVWKQFDSSAGKPFWYNKYTNETTWRNLISETCDDLQSDTVHVLEV